MDLSGLRLVHRMRSHSISSLTSFIVMNAVATSAHLAVHTHAFLMSCSSYAHRGAARRLALGVAHEPLTISQHPHTHPLDLGPLTDITEVLRAGLRRFACFGTEYLFRTALGGEYMSKIHPSTGRRPLNSFVMLRPNVGRGLMLVSFVRVIGKSRDGVSRERCLTKRRPLLDISIVVPAQAEGEWGCTALSLAKRRPAPTAAQGIVFSEQR